MEIGFLIVENNPVNIALVIPWFGKNLKGGAEQLAWQAARRLAGRGHNVEVLTTCSESFLADWDVDFYPPGREHVAEEDFIIRRFPLAPRVQEKFEQACHQLMLAADRLSPGISPVSGEMASDFSRHNINSDALLAYLRDYADSYDVFLFLPYLYGPILNGLPLVKERAVLQPCLHDEAYAYLPDTEKIFRCCRKIFFNSHGEFQLALNLYGPGIYPKSLVIGSGVELLEQDIKSSEDKLFEGYTPYSYFLYAGRRDSGKNVDMLCRTFRRYKQVYGGNIKLALIGPGVETFSNQQADIIDLGLVSETTKNNLIHHCLALVNPSANESYSRVIMEAWQAGRPVVAHQNCLATAMAVERAGGGWTAGSEQQWLDIFAHVAAKDFDVLRETGERGREYAREFADWDRVIDRYEDVFAEMMRVEPGKKKYSGLSIHQVLPNLSYGDAISNHARAVRKYLLSHGADSRIFVRHFHEKVCAECEVFAPDTIKSADLILYHHSIGTEVTEQMCRHQGSKFLVYHNITPARFFKRYDQVFERLMVKGRKDLPALAHCFKHCGGDSLYNCQELEEAGFNKPMHLPLVLDPDAWNFSPDQRVMEQMSDGRKNILFAGRISPNKCQHDLVRVMDHLVHVNPDVRLTLAGGFNPNDMYYTELKENVVRMGLSHWVHIPGHVSDEALHAYFKTAHLYCSMSEHEGFGVPLIEAMWFDIPVFAFKSSAVPETLGNAGMMFTEKENFPELAEAVQQLLIDNDLREKIIRAQRKRRMELLPQYAYDALDDMLQTVLGN